MEFELMTVKGHQLVIPTPEVIDAFIKCRDIPSINLIRELCNACNIEAPGSVVAKLYKSYFLYKNNDSILQAHFHRFSSSKRVALEDVAEATVALNTIYSTRLKDSYSTAEHIYTRINEIMNTNHRK